MIVQTVAKADAGKNYKLFQRKGKCHTRVHASRAAPYLRRDVDFPSNDDTVSPSAQLCKLLEVLRLDDHAA